MNDEMLAKSVVTRVDQLHSDRKNFHTLWQQAGELIYPLEQEFETTRTNGESLTDRIVDSTAPRALEMFAGIMEHMLTPAHMKWHTLKINNAELANKREAKLWLEEANNTLFALRYSNESNFSSQMNSVFKNIGAFGTGTLFVDNAKPGFWYKSIPLSLGYLDTDYKGIVNRYYYVMKYNSEQAIEAFGEKNLPEEVVEDAQNGRTSEKMEFVQGVFPNKDYVKDSFKIKESKFISVVVLKKDNSIVSKSYFKEFPFPTGRYAVAPNEIYGRGPGVTVLPDIK